MIGRPSYRVTVIRQLGGVGDMLMLSPVFRGLKEKYGRRCRVTVATSWLYKSGCLPLLLKGNPYIDHVSRVEPTDFAPFLLRYQKREYASVPYDEIPHCVLDADLVCDVNVCCAIRESQQQPRVRDHRTDIWCEAVGVQPSVKRPILYLSKDELREGKDWCDHYLGVGVRVGLVLDAVSPYRIWPTEYSHLFAQEATLLGYKMVTLDATKKVDGVVPCVGKNIRQVAAIIAHLDGVISHDTGLLHIAGAVGTPVLGLFGSTDGAIRMREYAGHYTVANNLAECAPCWYTNPCAREKDTRKHIVCMKRIRPELVLHELEVMLERFGVTLPYRRPV